MNGAAFIGTTVGSYIETNWPHQSTVALSTAGSTPYYAPDFRFVDMLGLNDRTIAKRSDTPIRTRWQLVPGHGKGDGAYVLARAPQFIILGPAEGTTLERPWFLSDIELAESPDFRRCYKEEHVSIPPPAQATSRAAIEFVYYRRVCPVL